MKKDVDISAYFIKDKAALKQLNSLEGAEREPAFWLDRAVEERYYAIEFLRAQYIEKNNLPQTMDRQYFEYR